MTANTITINPIASATIDSPTTITGTLTVNKDIYLSNARAIYAKSTSGTNISLIDLNSGNNMGLGYGLYEAGIGSTQLWGNSIRFWVKEAGSANYKPYFSKGDTIQVVGSVAGCIIAEVTRVEFQLQLSKPIIGNPTITVSTAGGFVIRESGKYLYGCSNNGYTTDISKYVVVTRDDSGLLIQVYFNNSTNVSAINRPVSVGYNLNITFS
jgi:hypothetical protein